MRRENEGAAYRHQRLQDLMFEELEGLLRDDVSDPALSRARITGVVLSVDYRHARVHFSVVAASDDGAHDEASERARTERAFVRATPFFRARLVDAIDLKRAPDLRFVFDGLVSGASVAPLVGEHEGAAGEPSDEIAEDPCSE